MNLGEFIFMKKEQKKTGPKGLTQERERKRETGPAAALLVVGIRRVFYEPNTILHTHTPPTTKKPDDNVCENCFLLK
jgi:hypothetical protein